MLYQRETPRENRGGVERGGMFEEEKIFGSNVIGDMHLESLDSKIHGIFFQEIQIHSLHRLF